VRLSFEGRREDVSIAAEKLLPGKRNFFLGRDPKGWRTGVEAYGRLRYHGLYSGVDLALRAEHGVLEYDLELTKDADLDHIIVRCEGVEKGKSTVTERYASARSRGRFANRRQVVVSPGFGRAARRCPLPPARGEPVRLRVRDAARAAGPPHRAADRLVDILGGSWGGSLLETCNALSVLPSGEVIVVGETGATNFPTTPGVFDRTVNDDDAFITKLTGDGSALVFSTVLGGAALDTAHAVAVGSDGSIFVTGEYRIV